LGISHSYAVELVEQGTSRTLPGQKAEEFKPDSYAYCIPKDLYQLRTRAKTRGDNSVSLMAAIVYKARDVIPMVLGLMDDTRLSLKYKGHTKAVDQLFDLAVRQIDAGLTMSRAVAIGVVISIGTGHHYHRIVI